VAHERRAGPGAADAVLDEVAADVHQVAAGGDRLHVAVELRRPLPGAGALVEALRLAAGPALAREDLARGDGERVDVVDRMVLPGGRRAARPVQRCQRDL